MRKNIYVCETSQFQVIHYEEVYILVYASVLFYKFLYNSVMIQKGTETCS
jgi:hypothetical protein